MLEVPPWSWDHDHISPWQENTPSLVCPQYLYHHHPYWPGHWAGPTARFWCWPRYGRCDFSRKTEKVKVINVLLYIIYSCQRSLGPLSFFSYLMRLPEEKRVKRQYDETVELLEKSLGQAWAKLDKMLLCSKQLTCMLQYKGSFKLGGRKFEANLVQSLSFVIERIHQITERLVNARK